MNSTVLSVFQCCMRQSSCRPSLVGLCIYTRLSVIPPERCAGFGRIRFADCNPQITLRISGLQLASTDCRMQMEECTTLHMMHRGGSKGDQGDEPQSPTLGCAWWSCSSSHKDSPIRSCLCGTRYQHRYAAATFHPRSVVIWKPNSSSDRIISTLVTVFSCKSGRT